MSKYYKTNKLYDHLTENPQQNLWFPKGDLWGLVYGSKPNCAPRVLVLAMGLQKGEQPSDEARYLYKLLHQISTRTKLPLCVVAFHTDVDSINNVGFSLNGTKLKMISLIDLAKEFKSLGLPVATTPPPKSINSQSSSAYQNWQMKTLGNRISVADIDLFKLSSSGSIERFYELKRSIKSLSVWEPYEEDFNGYHVLSNLANQYGVDLKIAYNQRTKTPWNDDISQIKVYDVNFSKPSRFGSPSTMTLEEFLSY